MLIIADLTLSDNPPGFFGERDGGGFQSGCYNAVGRGISWAPAPEIDHHHWSGAVCSDGRARVSMDKLPPLQGMGEKGMGQDGSAVTRDSLDTRSAQNNPSWPHCEALIKAFEESWQRGQAPAVGDYLRGDGAERIALLVELIHADLEFRLKAGQPARVESYLQDYPELAGQRSAVMELVAAEYELRQRRRDGVTLDEYGRRFPDYGEELIEYLEAAVAVTRAPSGPRARSSRSWATRARSSRP